jgi:hypothetical protein
MSRFSAVSAALLAMAAVAAEESFLRPVESPGTAPQEPLVVTRGNITAQREYAGGTSSYYDLRLGDAGVVGGLPMPWSHALVGVGLRQREVFRDANSVVVQPPGQPYAPGAQDAVETRLEYSATYRQGLWTPWAWDAELDIELGLTDMESDVSSVVGGTYTETAMFSDPRILLRIPLWQERYAGVMLGVGASVGLGDSEDWLTAHDGFGAILSLGWSGPVTVLDMVSARAQVTFTSVPGATQRLYTTGENVEGSYVGVQAGAGLDWRLNRRLSLGGTIAYEQHTWDNLEVGSVDVGNEEIVTSSIGGYGRVQWPDRWFTTLSLSGEGLTNTDQDRSVSVSLRFEGSPW